MITNDGAIHCSDCASFTTNVPADEPGKPIFFKRGVHGLCKGSAFNPRHIVHRDSVRCVWFVSNEQHRKDSAIPVDYERGSSKLFYS